MRQRARTTSSLRTDLYDEQQSPKTGLIACSLLFIQVFQELCHLDIIYWFIKGLKSVKGSLIWAAFRFSAALAAASTSSLPGMPTWLGSQQNKTFLDFEILWCFKRSCWMRGLLVFRLAKDWRTESESENMMNFCLLLDKMNLKARSIASVSEKNWWVVR